MKRRGMLGNSLMDGLIHHYKFDGNVKDSVGDLDGIASGLTYDTMAVFNGSATVTFNRLGVPEGDSPKTISFWMEPSTFNAGAPIYIGNGSISHPNNLDIRAMNSNIFYIYFGNSSATWNISINGLNMWTLVYSGGNMSDMLLYKNGAKVGTPSVINDKNLNIAGTLRFGVDLDGVKYRGRLGDVRLFDKALSDEEVLSVYRL